MIDILCFDVEKERFINNRKILYSSKYTKDFIKIAKDKNSEIVYAPLINKIISVDKNRIKKSVGKKDVKEFSDGKKEEFSTITINVTSECNFGCTYCNIHEVHKKPQTINFEFAKKGIDYILNSGKPIWVSFKGEGEPTLRFDMIKKIIDYVKGKSNEIKFHIITNGIFDEQKTNWLSENMDFIEISCDGPPEIQDRQRPLKNGKPSSSFIEKTIESLENCNEKVRIKSTVTEFSVNKLNLIVEYFEKFNMKNLYIRPVYFWEDPSVIRSFLIKQNLNPKFTMSPEPYAFVKNFLEARELAKSYGMNLITDDYPIKSPKKVYCEAYGKNLILLSSGYITSCPGVISPKGFLKSKLIFGRFDERKKDIIINKNKLKCLRKSTIETNKKCSKCEIKWNCGGECIYYKERMKKHYSKECEKQKFILKSYLTFLTQKYFFNNKIKI